MNFFDRLELVIVPMARKLDLLGPQRRTYCNRGMGPFDSEIAACCYCVCHAAMHYSSYQEALKSRFKSRFGLPKAPVVVDLGCGPATTLFALHDWLEPTSCSYIGIDNSQTLLDIAAALINVGNSEFDAQSLFLRRSESELSEADLGVATNGCDGVIFAMSYVVHQAFMDDMTLLARLMRRVRAAAGSKPAWFLLQDANFPDRPNQYTEIWPEERIRKLADLCREFGYTVNPRKRIFPAPHVSLSDAGRFVPDSAQNANNICVFFDRIEVD